VRGLTTLKVGQSKAQVETIQSGHRRLPAHDHGLKLAFLSSLVLKLLAGVAVALVAMSVGLRLLWPPRLADRSLALVLAGAYLPLRSVG
jgi:ABC-type transport system involved in cytochrome bd biosynthesis fused ATPase/permease subunit